MIHFSVTCTFFNDYLKTKNMYIFYVLYIHKFTPHFVATIFFFITFLIFLSIILLYMVFSPPWPPSFHFSLSTIFSIYTSSLCKIISLYWIGLILYYLFQHLIERLTYLILFHIRIYIFSYYDCTILLGSFTSFLIFHFSFLFIYVLEKNG